MRSATQENILGQKTLRIIFGEYAMMTEFKRIYFDTTPLIYYLDSVQPYAQKVRSFIAESLARESSFMTSTIANTEYLVIPFRVQNIRG